MLGLLSFSVVCGYLLIKFIIFTVKHVIRRSKYSNFPQLPTSFYFGETTFFKRKPINICEWTVACSAWPQMVTNY